MGDEYQMTAAEIQAVRDMMAEEREKHCEECQEDTEAQGISFNNYESCERCLYKEVK